MLKKIKKEDGNNIRGVQRKNKLGVTRTVKKYIVIMICSQTFIRQSFNGVRLALTARY